MSEYDSTHVYVPLERLQEHAVLDDVNGRGAVNQIQIKVKPDVRIDMMAEKLQLALDELGPMFFRVSTWEQKQGPLLGRSPSSRASSTSSCSSSSPWPGSASWRSSR